ncbi:GNAT family N-acetyltransferase [Roseateles oligotrophus]|uniref:GNAT family N-acetyltransferase n=1 Tax=Roseateles oligotrophus TaxID=1769250 RepID=A0ABT2YD10_9BURK|nr:GNAT family N-acetyltransferase [Roseateles oligotrophus]MCV2367916.1 GNAT family N-acetyltransferase [Roseateles oligotrophus]
MKTLHTDRLVIRPMSAVADAAFMLTLLNDATWLRFIGDRGVRTLEEAQRYIETGPVDMYARLGFGFCIVESKQTGLALGACGISQRDYLDSPDIGFAFLPQHAGQGYAFEAAAAVLRYAQTELGLTTILATTRLDNLRSQQLLEKLGLRFERLMPHPDGSERQLMVYGIRAPEPDFLS